MSIRCGNGNHTHETVAEVRACYNRPDRTAQQFRTNRFAGTCKLCGGNVPAEAGRCDRGESGWEVFHLPGECPEKVDIDADVNRTLRGGPDNRYAIIEPGHYATKSLTGNNDYDFWRVDRPDEGTYAGKTFVKRVIGGKPSVNVNRPTKFAALEAILTEGIDVCGQRYGVELGQCRRCNRHLTDQVSRAAGIGPDCANR